MNISGLRRNLPGQNTEKGRQIAETLLRGTRLKGSLKKAATAQLMTIPEAWLERLADENLAYVALGYGEDLSQTDLITSYKPERLKKDAVKAKEVAAEARKEVYSEFKDADTNELQAWYRSQELEKRLGVRLEEAGLGFAVKVSRDLIPMTFLEQEMGVAPDRFDDYLEPQETEQGLFREILLDLNGPEVVKKKGGESRYAVADDAMIQGEDKLILVPYLISNGKRLSPVSKESYSQINGMGMDQHYGAHYWPNRLIVMDDEVAKLPSQKTGYHSVLLHETGHAIDYIAEGIDDLNHRETMDALYEKDLARAKAGERSFLTGRASDNVREYFAEAVEAYLTVAVEINGNNYKAKNHHEALKENNPELFAYVDKLMKLPGIKKDQ